MAYSITGFCDALLADLTAEVAGLRDCLVHRYATYDPEQFVAEQGERHLAVWPADEIETAVPLVTGPGGDILVQSFQIAYWEFSEEGIRGVLDEPAASDLLGLLEQTRARIYAIGNTFLGESELVRYLGARWSGRSGLTRWFQLAVSSRTSQIIT